MRYQRRYICVYYINGENIIPEMHMCVATTNINTVHRARGNNKIAR